MQSFYSRYFRPHENPNDKTLATKVTPEKEIQISADIARGLLASFNNQS